MDSSLRMPAARAGSAASRARSTVTGSAFRLLRFIIIRIHASSWGLFRWVPRPFGRRSRSVPFRDKLRSRRSNAIRETRNCMTTIWYASSPLDFEF